MRHPKLMSLASFCVLACSSHQSSRLAFTGYSNAQPPREAPLSSYEPEMPLHTRGRFIVDVNEHRVKLASVNWYGASDTRMVPGGLDRVPLAHIVEQIKALGFNSVRLPFSNFMLYASRVDDQAVAANPQLFGLTPIRVYDRVVEALTDAGVLVILNNHTTHPMWCCSYEHDGLWYTSDYSEDRWLDDWALMARRYRANTRVIGADLRNEIRVAKWNGTFVPNLPHWGSGPNDWRAAAERAGLRVLAENPKLLIIVEGINFPRDHLRGVATAPVRLPLANHLVYAAHNYAFTAPSPIGPTYGDLDQSEFNALMHQEWGFVVTPNQAFTAPVWVSEFGESIHAVDRSWYTHIIEYLREGDFDFAYWALNAGPKASGAEETFSLLADDWSSPLSDWRVASLKTLMRPRIGPGIEPQWEDQPQNHFAVQTFSDGDTIQSADLQDWIPHAYKSRCREGGRVVGLSIGKRAAHSFAHGVLCSDYGLALGTGKLLTLSNHDHNQGDVGTHTQGKDWADGAVKLECPLNSYVAGVAQTRRSLKYWFAGVLCAEANKSLGMECHSVDFFDQDDRATEIPGDWDPHMLKGQCGLNEYTAGVSAAKGHVRSLLCCK